MTYTIRETPWHRPIGGWEVRQDAHRLCECDSLVDALLVIAVFSECSKNRYLEILKESVAEADRRAA